MFFVNPTRVRGFERLCYVPGATGPGGERVFTPLTQAVAMLCEATGIGRLTGPELHLYIRRVQGYQEHLGPVLLQDGTRQPVTVDDIHAHAELEVKVTTHRTAAAWERHLDLLCRQYARAE